MSRSRTYLGLVAGVMLVASSAAHSLLGWPQLRAQLEGVHAPADLVTGLAIGWHFAGIAILTFGCLALWTFADRLRGRTVSTRHTTLIAVVYLLFGVGALVASRMDPFFLVFIVPGLLLLIASWQSAPREVASVAAAV